MHSHIASLRLDGHVRRQLACTVEKHGMCIVGNYGLPTHGFNRLPYSLPLEREKKRQVSSASAPCSKSLSKADFHNRLPEG